MKWYDQNDKTAPIITAQGLLHSAHGAYTDVRLPETCVLFEIGMAMNHVERTFDTHVLIDKLPCLLDTPRCIGIADMKGVCCVKGGFGAPSAVDTLETLIALGVRRLIVSGMLGVFASHVHVGDVVIPRRMISEEGTSRHYCDMADGISPDRNLHEQAVRYTAPHFATYTDDAVSTDGVYRQTFEKESMWRGRGCVGVDMESSALLAAARYHGIPAVTLLIGSDKHPMQPGDPAWDWGNEGFDAARERFVELSVRFAGHVSAVE